MAPDGAWSRRPLETAAEYAALGLAILPECAPTCPTCEPRNRGKVPWDPMTARHMGGWQRREGPPTVAELDGWLEADRQRIAAGQGPLNIGCLCGPRCLGEEGLIGADADGPRGVAALALHLGLAPGVLEEAVADYRESGIFAPALGTAAYLTPSGGMRVLWRVPAGRALRTAGKDAGHDGLRLAWAGGQIVLPPSTRADGDYRWLPGHSPWQTEIAAAPASVLATMSGKPGHASTPSSVTLLPMPTYPAATGNLGPDRDGRLADASWLPYHLNLLRDGVPQGQRSEAVRRLELQMLAEGWTLKQVVAALAGQPWVQAMRSNIVGWLTADVLRAQAWVTTQDAQAVGDAASGGPVDLWMPRRRHPRPAPSRQDQTPPPESAPVTNGPTSPPGDDPQLRRAVADAYARWYGQQAMGGGQPPKQPDLLPAVATTDGAGEHESLDGRAAKASKQREPSVGATVLSPSGEQLARWLKAPKRSVERSGPQEDSATIRLSAPIRLGTVWVKHVGHEAGHAALRPRDFILRIALAAAEYAARYEEGVTTVRKLAIPATQDGRSYRRGGCAEQVSRRLALHLDRLMEGPRYCGKQAAFREAPAFNSKGDLFHVHHSTHAPCGQRGCRRCAEVVAAVELAQHAERLRLIYGDEPVVVLRCSTRGFSLPAAQVAARKLLKNSAVRQAVGAPGVLCGYLCAEPQEGRIAYGPLLAVPGARVEVVTAAVRAAWCRLAPGGTVAVAALPGLPQNPNAMEALVVAHVTSDRAVLSTVGAGVITPEVACAAYGVEIGCDLQHPDAGPVRRWIASPGWRGLLPVLDQVPVGAYLDPGSCPACHEAQRVAVAEGVFGHTGTAVDVSPDGTQGVAKSTGTGLSEDGRREAMRRARGVREVRVPGTDITVLAGAPCRWDGEALSEPMWWHFQRKPVREFSALRGADSVVVLVPEQALRRSGAA